MSFQVGLQSAVCQDATAAGERLEVKSKRLELDTSGKKAEFVGDVVVRKGKLYLRCEALSATYDDQGLAVRVRARGKVKVSHGDVFATAERAVYDRASETVSLDGSPVVWRGAQKISGTAMKIHLKSERIEVDNPRGTVALPGPAVPRESGSKP